MISISKINDIINDTELMKFIYNYFPVSVLQLTPHQCQFLFQVLNKYECIGADETDLKNAVIERIKILLPESNDKKICAVCASVDIVHLLNTNNYVCRKCGSLLS